ncbi:protein-l-isoaspartate(D-aspartate) O-methyltransferase [Candidatus Nitrosoglobus terrae]|uniref:Protein-L-isoaspartate O-methyltransferase n=1 Tax=Candidatus Nitrosoglobus terrae TaxID=1630141 RepID=A0A1Q2SKP3_9GAMM|nr:protein-L-isoaspartate O-methyltransferase [Candidatus Nitrosoglobus terrae]BAW79721.1 protein-l-isoaspartate(D-aspartate) O-methyltransferase [Candidatus Nitrosoglobus terrae]
MSLEQARSNMIKRQIRPWEVFDQRVLDRLTEISREDFTPPEFRNLAYADIQIPIGHGQVMLSPGIEGRLLQALALRGEESVLEIGTGTGYLTTVLAGLANRIVSVDIFPDLQRFNEHRPENIFLQVGDAAYGWSKDSCFDAIVISGSLPSLPKIFLETLNLNGRLFAVLGQAPVMKAVLITRITEQEWSREKLFETVIPPLLNSELKPKFIF